ncbi:MAG: sporulation-delaying protein SdpB family protein [Acidobacteriota bacterium]|jgi:antimicrobial peptide system SdpB family protein
MNPDRHAAPPWTNVYGVARTVLALGTLINLACHDVNVLFRPLGVELGEAAGDIRLVRLSLFSILSGERLELARWLGILILLVVASGWRPRLTGPLHWWVTFSFATSCVVVEGGDQVAANLTLLLLPVTLTDPRRSHWSAPPAIAGPRQAIAALTARSALMVARIQVGAIYFVACVSKLGVEEWTNGTALYYWFLHPVFGLSGWRRTLMMPLLTHPTTIVFLTWGSLALEALLFMGLLIDRRHRPALLVAGLFFHAGIALVHGLVTFCLAMTAALVLYLRPPEERFAAARLNFR